MELRARPFFLGVVLALTFSVLSYSQTQPADRLSSAIAASQRAVINAVHPLATKQNDIGRLAGSQVLSRMVLVLQRSAQQESALQQLLAAQQDPKSPQYHQWLTADEFGQQFGPSDNDMAKIQGWLQGQGFSVEAAPHGRQYLLFTGTSAQVETAFQTQMHQYRVNGTTYIANAVAATIPKALAPDVKGLASLNGFEKEQFIPKDQGQPSPQAVTANGSLLLGPADMDAIYDATPLQKANIQGQGQTIAVIGQYAINPQAVSDFRAFTGLPPANLNIIVNGNYPGSTNGEELGDVEWAGSMAPAATLDLIASPSTGFLPGIAYSQMYAVDYDVAQITSMSYAECENALDTELPGAVQLFGMLYEQGAAEGISQFAASGDSGGDVCVQAFVGAGYGVNGIGDSPWNVSVGGTEFVMPDPSVYFPNGIATGYIPESAWNETGLNTFVAGGGGPSAIWSKPAWQAGPGVPADGARDTPDISLNAEDYLMCAGGCTSGYYGGFGGTSASTPTWAGIQALVNQKNGIVNGAGNPNPTYYQLAAGANSPFHDITTGNTYITELSSLQEVGYPATPGYDMATGLGSVDVNKLATNWMPPTGSGAATVALNDGGLATITHGGPLTANVTVSASGSTTPTGDVVLFAGTQGVVQATLAGGVTSWPFGSGSGLNKVELPGL